MGFNHKLGDLLDFIDDLGKSHLIDSIPVLSYRKFSPQIFYFPRLGTIPLTCFQAQPSHQVKLFRYLITNLEFCMKRKIPNPDHSSFLYFTIH